MKVSGIKTTGITVSLLSVVQAKCKETQMKIHPWNL